MHIIVLIGSYLLGSVPFGLIVGKVWMGVDIREYGSGNIGATNTMRTLGRGPAVVVFVLDVAKGLFPALASKALFPDQAWMAVVVGAVAIVGHVFPVFLKFRGGKGVATSLGVLFGLDWRVAVIAFVIWVVAVYVSKYVSVASILASASIPVLMLVFRPGPEYMAYRIFGITAALFVIAKHRSNIGRLMQGKEHRWGEKVKVK